MYNTPEMLLLGQNIKDETLEAAKARVNCHDVVNMQYTSGTTGFPKGHVDSLQHRQQRFLDG